MAIVVLQHAEECSAGRLGVTLRDLGLAVDVRRLDLPKNHAFNRGRCERQIGVPIDLDDVHGVVILGGPQNVGDNQPWMAAEIEFIRRAHAAELPILGICLGAQLIAHTLGGQVGPMDKPEVGFVNVKVSVPGQIETLLAGVPWDHPQFASHGQEIKQLPAGSTHLMSSAACKNQAFKAGVRTYGFQFHFELDRPMIDALVQAEGKQCQAAGVSAQEIASQADKHYATFARVADRLCLNAATFLFTSAAHVRA